MPDLGFTDLILGFLLLITPVVYFHELGHYWVARKAGVVVEVFSIGFGRMDSQNGNPVAPVGNSAWWLCQDAR
jgi:hypothetical protein